MVRNQEKKEMPASAGMTVFFKTPLSKVERHSREGGNPMIFYSREEARSVQ